jgi:hypothetical protein
MGSGPRWLLIGAVILLGLGEWAWGYYSTMSHMTAMINAQSARHVTSPSLPAAKARQFTRDETYAFIAAAKQAEAIKDPLQRCLAYPDPPGSHWSKDAVAAYCHYRVPSVLTFAQAQKLIQNGHAAELDRRLAAALHAQQTDAASPGLLDRIYRQDFDDGSFDIRPTLDAWKRDSPDSAFAWAASGTAYVAMAYAARGGALMKDTADSSVDAMDKLLVQADSDLRRAIALNPQVTPAHVALINAGGLGYDRAYTDAAIHGALAAVPDDYAIYTMAMWTLQPKWGGSLAAMDQLAAQAQLHASANPLMKLLLSERPYYEVDNCGCAKDVELAAYPAALDQLTNSTYLGWVGFAAKGRRNTAVSAIYLSETQRFAPDRVDARIQRTYALVDFDEADWAVADLNLVLTTSPQDTDALNARAYAYEMQGDDKRAEQDQRALLAINPNDTDALARLGNLLVHSTHEWNEGWDIASRLIAAQPKNPYGWMLRATIQARQPRAGLKDTVDYFEAHFSSDPRLRKIATQMRSFLTLQTHSGKQVLAGKAPSHG